jgi:hypothetical protein
MNKDRVRSFETLLSRAGKGLISRGISGERVGELVADLVRRHGRKTKVRFCLRGQSISVQVTRAARIEASSGEPALRALTTEQRRWVGDNIHYAAAVAYAPYRYVSISSRLPMAVFELGREDAAAIGQLAVIEKASEFDQNRAAASTFVTRVASFAILNAARALGAAMRGGNRKHLPYRDLCVGRDDEPLDNLIAGEETETLLRQQLAK